MGNKKPTTPRSRIRNAVRQMWLRSRERQKAIQATKNCCTECGVKGSVAKGREVKINVHHCEGIIWERMYKAIRDDLLNQPQTTLCKSCHKKEG